MISMSCGCQYYQENSLLLNILLQYIIIIASISMKWRKYNVKYTIQMLFARIYQNTINMVLLQIVLF